MSRNVDPAEIEKFDALAERWWDSDGEMAPLHHINAARLEYLEDGRSLEGLQIADIGCGGGILAEAMAQRGAKVTGIDLAGEAIDVARQHAEAGGMEIDYRCQSSTDLASEQPGSFDVVTCMELLEHVPDPSALIRDCRALVKTDGQVYFSTINRNPKAWALAIVAAEYLLNLVPRGTHDYGRFIKPSELGRWCREAGLAVEDVSGLIYNPVLKDASIGRDVDVNYIMRCRPADA